MRRVKYDAADRIPYMQCRARHIACELIDSKRGRTKRSTPRRRLRSNHATTASIVGSPENLDQAQPSRNNFQNDQHEQVETSECPPAETGSIQQPEGRTDNSSDSLTLSYALQTARHAKEANSQHLPFQNLSCTSSNEGLIFHSSVTSLEPVSLQDALMMPDRQVSDKLIRSFFQHFFPA
ncbi:unnamed protein product [Clonostachys rosea]|uniref:Uncharacterized protein n=1 Tax=Bionectria ochroleuca TaxID=29856 RepID=A0ABY6UH04_BIOOC|nr:unnamed protein product [Clonostachys rosea]